MRIGTWNLDGRWGPGHARLIESADCDVWLLTEVNVRTQLDGFQCHVTGASMGRAKHWAGVCSRRPMRALPDPHRASAAALVDGTTYCSSVLPWRSCGPSWPGSGHAERTRIALAQLLDELPVQSLVWGGDWNQALSGADLVGSEGGRRHVQGAVERLELQVPTARSAHRISGLSSIDHVAVAVDRVVSRVEHWSATGLSDHDAYVVQTEEAAGEPG